jgi:hypothetical protein
VSRCVIFTECYNLDTRQSTSLPKSKRNKRAQARRRTASSAVERVAMAGRGWPGRVGRAGLVGWAGGAAPAAEGLAGWCSGDGTDAGAAAVGYGVGKKSEVKKKAGLGYVNWLCRVSAIWHSAKLFFNLKIHFVECPRSDTQESSLCRVPSNRHSTKIVLIFFKILCHVSHGRHSAKNVSPSVLFWHSATYIFIFFFSQPNFLWFVPTLCIPTCSILAQL